MTVHEMDCYHYGLRFSSEVMGIVFSCATGRKPIPNDQLTGDQLFGLFTLFYDCHNSLTPIFHESVRDKHAFMEHHVFRDGLSIRGFKHILSHDSQAEYDAGFAKWLAGGGTTEALRTLEGRKNFFWYIWIERMLTRLQTTECISFSEDERRYVIETVTARKPLKPVRDRTLWDTYSLTCQQAFKGMCAKTHGIEYYDWIETFRSEVLDLSD